MTIVYLSLFCLLINNNSTVVPNALSQVTHTRSGEKLKKKCFSGKTGDKPRASLRRQLNGRVTHTCKLFHYNKMCSRTFKTVINNNIKSKQINSNIHLDRKAFSKSRRHKHTLTLTAKLNVNVSKEVHWSEYCGKEENWS